MSEGKIIIERLREKVNELLRIQQERDVETKRIIQDKDEEIERLKSGHASIVTKESPSVVVKDTSGIVLEDAFGSQTETEKDKKIQKLMKERKHLRRAFSKNHPPTDKKKKSIVERQFQKTTEQKILCTPESLAYLSNPFGDFNFGEGKNNKLDVVFDCGVCSYRTLLFGIPLTSGIWKLTLSVAKFHPFALFGIGAAEAEEVDNVLRSLLGWGVKRGVGYVLWSTEACLRNHGIDHDLPSTYKGMEGAQIGAEVNMEEHTLRFFNNSVEVPYIVTKLPDIIHLGYSSNYSHIVKFVSLNQVSRSTLTSIPFSSSYSSSSSSSSSPPRVSLTKAIKWK